MVYFFRQEDIFLIFLKIQIYRHTNDQPMRSTFMKACYIKIKLYSPFDDLPKIGFFYFYVWKVISSNFLSNAQMAANLKYPDELLIFVLIPYDISAHSFENKLKFGIKISRIISFVYIKQIISLWFLYNGMNLEVMQRFIE